MHMVIKASVELAEQLRVVLQSSFPVCAATCIMFHNWLDVVSCFPWRRPISPVNVIDYRGTRRRAMNPKKPRQQLMRQSMCSPGHLEGVASAPRRARFSASSNTDTT